MPSTTSSSSTSDSDTSSDDPVVLQDDRYLVIKDDTGEKLTVFGEYYTRKDSAPWTRHPEAPATSDKTLSFEIEAGAQAHLEDSGEAIHASRARTWAMSATGTPAVWTARPATYGWCTRRIARAISTTRPRTWRPSRIPSRGERS
jgi:hypothetical protein